MGTISRNCFPFATDVLGGASDTKPTLMARTISPRLVTLPLDSHLETRGCPEEVLKAGGNEAGTSIQGSSSRGSAERATPTRSPSQTKGCRCPVPCQIAEWSA
ncbi:hypothetical protein J6590_040682 [Homalodisca vitripennis]|nr:hypothetical protein J6590_040682 [Homalodisca vitripennis]